MVERMVYRLDDCLDVGSAAMMDSMKVSSLAVMMDGHSAL